MKNIKVLSLAITAVVLAFAAIPANASSLRVCQDIGYNGTPTAQFKARTSGNLYTLSGRGCTVAKFSDMADFLAAGFRSDPPVAYVNQATAAASVTIPAGAYIDSITVQETSGAAATGGFKIGTTAGGTDVVAAAVVGASSIVTITDVSLLKRAFSATAPQTLFMGSVTNFTDGPAFNVTIKYSYF
jgi:hypothetical protein